MLKNVFFVSVLIIVCHPNEAKLFDKLSERGSRPMPEVV